MTVHEDAAQLLLPAPGSRAFWGYIREADKWTDAASEDIGL